MNQTLLGGFRQVESTFSFLEDQIQAYNLKQLNKQVQSRRLVKRLSTVLTAITLVTVINLQQLKTEAENVSAVPIAQPTLETDLKLDSNTYSLLTIEPIQLVTITPGKSHAQEEAEAILKAKLAQSQGQTRTASTSASAVPTAVAHQMAQDAADKAGIPEHWKLLAALWQKETGKSGDSCIISRADGRATGPMQFMPGTFRAHAPRPDANICKATDSLEAAADLLKDSGLTEGDVTGAIYSYNHSMAYVHSVEQIAASIR